MNSEEKRFIAVTGSPHRKPRAMFLSTTEGEASAGWDLFPRDIIAAPIDIAIGYCRVAGVPEEGVYFIDAENINSITEGYQDTEIKLSIFILMCVNLNRQIIRYRKEQLLEDLFQLNIVAPSEQALAHEALREIAKDLANQPTTIYCKNDGEPIGILPDGERDGDADYIYILYTETADGQITYYRSENAKTTIRRKKQEAEIFKKAEAQAKTIFPDEDGCMWHVEKVLRVCAKQTMSDWIEITPPSVCAKDDTSGTITIERAEVGDAIVQKITVTDENGKSVSGTTKTECIKGKLIGHYIFYPQGTNQDDTKIITLLKDNAQEEIREYVVFYSPNRAEYKFYNVFSKEPKITIFGQSAILLTESAAEDMADVLSQNSPKSWFYYKADYFLRKEKQQSENDKPNADKG